VNKLHENSCKNFKSIKKFFVCTNCLLLNKRKLCFKICVLCFNQLCLSVNITCNFSKDSCVSCAVCCNSFPAGTYSLLVTLATCDRLSFLPSPSEKLRTYSSTLKTSTHISSSKNTDLCLLYSSRSIILINNFMYIRYCKLCISIYLYSLFL